jgi:hypothetical protein
MYMRVMAELDAEDDTVDAGEHEIVNITGTIDWLLKLITYSREYTSFLGC